MHFIVGREEGLGFKQAKATMATTTMSCKTEKVGYGRRWSNISHNLMPSSVEAD